MWAEPPTLGEVEVGWALPYSQRREGPPVPWEPARPLSGADAAPRVPSLESPLGLSVN